MQRPFFYHFFALFFWVQIFLPFYLFTKLDFFEEDAVLEFKNHGKLILEDDLLDFSGTLKIDDGTLFDKICNTDKNSFSFNKNSGAILHNGKKTFMHGASLFNNQKTSCHSFRNNSGRPSIMMPGNTHLDYPSQTVNDQVAVSASGNLITGQPIFTYPIVLFDSDTVLSLGIQNKLTQNIEMNGGKLILYSDLSLHDGVSLIGDGSVDVNNYTLSFPVNGWCEQTTQIKFFNANDIALSGYTQLDGTWTFAGEGSFSTINGYGNVLDISGGGSIVIGSGHTLYVTGIDLKGLGGLGGSLIFTDSTSTLKLASSVIEFDGPYVYPFGTISVISPNCKMVFGKNQYFGVVGPGAVFEVDGVIFSFEMLDNVSIFPPPFLMVNGGIINVKNNGIIQNNNLDIFKGAILYTTPSESGDNYIIGNATMTTHTRVKFVNENPNVIKNMTLNCTGKVVSYQAAEAKSVILEPGVNLLIKNVVAHALSFESLDLQGTGTVKAGFLFGDNVSFIIHKDTTVSDIPLKFTGQNSFVDGGNFVITLDGGPGCVTVSDGSTLTIANATVKVMNADAINLLGQNAKLILQNVYLELFETGLNVDTGSIFFLDYVEINASKRNTFVSAINFTSQGTLTVLAKSKLHINKGVSIVYNPVAKNNETIVDQKRRLFFEDSSSILSLSGCTIDASAIGISFLNGNLFINDKVSFHLDGATSGKELEMGTNCNLYVFSSAILDVDGPIKYILS